MKSSIHFLDCNRFDAAVPHTRCPYVTVVGLPFDTSAYAPHVDPAMHYTLDLLRGRSGFRAESYRFRGEQIPGVTGTTTTTTCAMAATSTTTTQMHPLLLGRPEQGYPCDVLEQGPIDFNIMAHNGDVASSRLRFHGYLADVMTVLCQCLSRHGLFDGTETFSSHECVHFCANGLQVFINTFRPIQDSYCWVWAPQFLRAPTAVRCDGCISRERLLHECSIEDKPFLAVVHNGIVHVEHVFPRHGEVVVIRTDDFTTHAVPLLNILQRVSDVQALLFPVAGLQPYVEDDPHRLWGLWRQAIAHGQNLLGLHQPGARATLACMSCPCVTIGAGTLLLPLTRDVQRHYDRHLKEHFGPMSFQDTGRCDRDFALLVERWQKDGKRLWNITLPTGIEVRSGSEDGGFLRGAPYGHGWVTLCTVHAGFVLPGELSAWKLLWITLDCCPVAPRRPRPHTISTVLTEAQIVKVLQNRATGLMQA